MLKKMTPYIVFIITFAFGSLFAFNEVILVGSIGSAGYILHHPGILIFALSLIELALLVRKSFKSTH